MKCIFVNKTNIEENEKNGNEKLPPLRIIQDNGRIISAHGIKLIKDGEVLAEFIYDPKNPMQGIKLWFQTNLELRVE